MNYVHFMFSGVHREVKFSFIFAICICKEYMQYIQNTTSENRKSFSWFFSSFNFQDYLQYKFSLKEMGSFICKAQYTGHFVVLHNYIKLQGSKYSYR